MKTSPGGGRSAEERRPAQSVVTPAGRRSTSPRGARLPPARSAPPPARASLSARTRRPVAIRTPQGEEPPSGGRAPGCPRKEGASAAYSPGVWALGPGGAGDAAAGPRALSTRRPGSTMPFPPVPPPPPTPAPGVPAARPPPPPRKPGAPRKAPAPPCAPPGPSPPAAAAEKKRRPPERPQGLLSSSWPSATLKRPPARRAPGPASPRALPPAAPGRPRAPAPCAPRPAGSGDGPAGSTASAAGPDAARRFSLSLTPEAVLVIQRRHLERQLLARPRRAPPAASADAGRPLGPCLPARAAGLGRRPPPPGALRGPDPGPRPADLRPLLKVSLLNDRHKYDDVEYEEEAAAADEGLVRKCTEWLRGVESAAAVRDRAGSLDALPHLSTL